MEEVIKKVLTLDDYVDERMLLEYLWEANLNSVNSHNNNKTEEQIKV